MTVRRGERILRDDIFNLTFFPVGMLLMYDGSGWVDNVTLRGWYLCDGTHGTPDLRNKFVRGGAPASRGVTGGGNARLTANNLPRHNHNVTGVVLDTATAHIHVVSNLTTTEAGAHDHTVSGTLDSGGSHYHYFPVTGGDDNNHSGTQGNGAADTDASFHDDSYTKDAGAHTHTVETSISGGAHTHTVSGDFSENGSHKHSIEGNAGVTGGGAAFNVEPACYTLIYIRKCA
ncbi:MAG: hypothetical protein LBJ25_01150 [Candidatus Margulisbacteria bacterium]|jgi:hypothetical protein|nr:hypothetical protein [Candidatus Margulisiibacteriota bacterium]